MTNSYSHGTLLVGQYGSDYTTTQRKVEALMRVLEDRETGTFTLTPTGTDEHTLVGELLARLSEGDKFKYNGQVQKGDDPIVLRFNIGGKSVRVPLVVEGKSIGSHDGFDGGVTFELSGSDDKSTAALGPMRDMCFFATGGLIFLRESEIDDIRPNRCRGLQEVQASLSGRDRAGTAYAEAAESSAILLSALQ